MEREFFATDVEGIESICAVGAVFEQVFLALRELFARLILAEAVATVGDTGGLNGKDKVFNNRPRSFCDCLYSDSRC